MFGAAFQDPRLRFKLFASRKELVYVSHDFADVAGLGAPSDSVVL